MNIFLDAVQNIIGRKLKCTSESLCYMKKTFSLNLMTAVLLIFCVMMSLAVCSFPASAQNGAGMVAERDGDRDGDGVVQGADNHGGGLIGDAASDGGNLVGDAASDAGDLVGDAASDAGDLVGDAASDVGDLAGDAASDVGDAADGMTSDGDASKDTTRDTASDRPAESGNGTTGETSTDGTPADNNNGSSVVTWVIVALIAAAVVVILVVAFMPKGRR